MEPWLFQKDVATIFNVSENCITDWQVKGSDPRIKYYRIRPMNYILLGKFSRLIFVS